MRFIGGIIGGVVAGLIGAIIWALISYYAHVQLGIIAWVIGGMVGFGVALGCRGDTGSETGAIAAIIALASILGGKYFAAVAFSSNFGNTSELKFTDTDAQESFAHELVAEAEKGTTPLKWPEGKSAENAETLADFPKDIAAKATKQWNDMSPGDQAAFKSKQEATLREAYASIRGTLTMAAFKSSFGFLSIVFCVFAVITAFKLGSGMSSDAD